MQMSIANNWINRAAKLGAHNHLAEPEIAEKQKAYADLNKRAAICKNQPPGSPIVTFSMELEEHVFAKFPAIEHTKKNIYNQRRKEVPPLPNDLKSLQIPNELQVIKVGEQELPMVAADTGAENGDQRIIFFAIQPHLEYLKICDTLICDETFDAVPLLTYQLYTIHGLVQRVVQNIYHICDTNKFPINLFHQVEMQPKRFFFGKQIIVCSQVPKRIN